MNMFIHFQVNAQSLGSRFMPKPSSMETSWFEEEFIVEVVKRLKEMA
jgi:hypothetical protein